VKIATWNINSIKSRLDHVLNWCATNQPDVLCLQETKCVDEKFPHQRIRALGYDYIVFHGERSYNGVAILSKYAIGDVQKNFPDDEPTAQKRLIAATIDGVRIVNTYVPHGTALGTDKFKFKLDWLQQLRKYFDQTHKPNENILLCGDLNVAPHELDVWSVPLWKEKVHFTKPERDAIQNLKKWGFVDVFRQINDDLKEYSWWDHMEWSFRKNQGLRIDHIWASPPLAERCTDCWIDKDPRSWDHPSDHAPVVAEFL